MSHPADGLGVEFVATAGRGLLAVADHGMCTFAITTGIDIFSTIYLTPLFLDCVRGFDPWQMEAAILSVGVRVSGGTTADPMAPTPCPPFGTAF
jgi:hypothetical protein